MGVGGVAPHHVHRQIGARQRVLAFWRGKKRIGLAKASMKRKQRTEEKKKSAIAAMVAGRKQVIIMVLSFGSRGLFECGPVFLKIFRSLGGLGLAEGDRAAVQHLFESCVECVRMFGSCIRPAGPRWSEARREIGHPVRRYLRGS